MPLRKLTSRDRTPRANWQLAALLAFAAGTVDVSGYLALRQFTSHMSGITASLAAALSPHGVGLLLRPALLLVSFLSGAAFCAVLVNWERRRDRESLFAVPVLIEAVLLTLPVWSAVHAHATLTLCLLSFSMGLQNAIITKISHAEIRTTHVTGMITDIGIELGRGLYWNRSRTLTPVACDREHLAHLCTLVGLFLAGGVAGAFAYPGMGFADLLPIAALLAVFTFLPILVDLRRHPAGRKP